MRSVRLISVLFFFFICIFFSCHKQTLEERFDQFDDKFFARHVPEFPNGRLLTKQDIPPEQQEYFDQNNAKLQLLLDLNQNGTPEYIICGVSDSLLQEHRKGAYFITIFEQTPRGIERSYLQKLMVAPVSIAASDDEEHTGVVLTFAFFSEFAAEIYYENGQYQLDSWYATPENSDPES